MSIDPLLEGPARSIFARHNCVVTVEGVQIAGVIPGQDVALTISQVCEGRAARYEWPQTSASVAALHGLSVTAEIDKLVDDFNSGALKKRVRSPLEEADLPQLDKWGKERGFDSRLAAVAGLMKSIRGCNFSTIGQADRPAWYEVSQQFQETSFHETESKGLYPHRCPACGSKDGLSPARSSETSSLAIAVCVDCQCRITVAWL
jgi:hypothetical protein